MLDWQPLLSEDSTKHNVLLLLHELLFTLLHRAHRGRFDGVLEEILDNDFKLHLNSNPEHQCKLN